MRGTIFTTHGMHIGDLLAGIRDLILDPDDQWHKGPTATLALDELLTDMDAVADIVSDAEHVADPVAVSLFLRWGRPVKLGDSSPDDQVGYLRAAPHGGDDVRRRDAHMLAVAGVLAFADYVTPECRHKRCSALCVTASRYWRLYDAMVAELWLSSREHAEVGAMATAIRKAIDARWTRRKRPTAVTTEKHRQRARTAAPREQEETMSEQREPITSTSIARRVAVAVKAEDYAAALAAIDEGEKWYPQALLPEGATWAKLRAGVTARRDKAKTRETPNSPAPSRDVVLAAAIDSGRASVTHISAPVAAPKKTAAIKARKATVAVSAAEPQEPKPVEKAEPAPASTPSLVAVPDHAAAVEPAAGEAAAAARDAEGAQDSSLPRLTIVHTIEGGTMLLGSTREVGKQVSRVLGKNGQRWSFSFKLPHGSGWYIMGSRPGGADMPRIVAAQRALQADGFPVTLDISTTDADGNVVAPKLSVAEQARRSRARSRAVDSLGWHLSCTTDGLACSSCRAPGLRPQTAKIVDDETGMPVVKCLACAGGAASVPVPQEPAAPVFPDVDEQDEQPDTGAVAKRGEESAPRPAGLAALDIDTLIALVKAGDEEAVEQIKRLTAQPTPPAAPRRPDSSARSARPARTKAPRVRREEPSLLSLATPTVADRRIALTVRLTDEAHVKKTAREVRQELYAQVTRIYNKYGVEIHVYGDRDERVLRISATVVNAPSGKHAEIWRRIDEVTHSVRGVAASLAETKSV